MTTRIRLPIRSALLLLLSVPMLLSICPAQETVELQKPKSTAATIQSPSPAPETKPTKFNLDFPGGTPAELVSAIQRASGRPLNGVIPIDLANTPLPPLKMEEVDVGHLFTALTNASTRQMLRGDGMWENAHMGFETQGKAGEESVWYFFSRTPLELPTLCRFYSLSTYIDEGLTVDDITTAIQTGWKLMKTAKEGTMSFHKETKLLIVVGNGPQLAMVEDALKALQPKFVPKMVPPAGKKDGK